jgi:hypothetical protein
VEYRLRAATKTDKTIAANVVIAYETLSGLQLGKWLARLQQFTPHNGITLFSTAQKPKWDSHNFCLNYAIPIVTQNYQSVPLFSWAAGRALHYLQPKYMCPIKQTYRA